MGSDLVHIGICKKRVAFPLAVIETQRDVVGQFYITQKQFQLRS